MNFAFRSKKEIYSALFFMTSLMPLIFLLNGCEKNRNRHQPPIQVIALETPVPTATPIATLVPTVTIAPTVTAVPTNSPTISPTEVPAVSPQLPLIPFKSEMALRIVPELSPSNVESGCDAIKLSDEIVVTTNLCVNKLLDTTHSQLRIFWKGAWVGSIGPQIDIFDSFNLPMYMLRNSSQASTVKFIAYFFAPTIIAELASARELKEYSHQRVLQRGESFLFLAGHKSELHAQIDYIAAGSSLRKSPNSPCKISDSTFKCRTSEFIIFDHKNSLKIGDLIVVKAPDSKEKIMGFVSANLFDIRLQKAHEIKSTPWIIEAP